LRKVKKVKRPLSSAAVVQWKAVPAHVLKFPDLPAYAKINGCYEALDGGFMNEVLMSAASLGNKP